MTPIISRWLREVIISLWVEPLAPFAKRERAWYKLIGEKIMFSWRLDEDKNENNFKWNESEIDLE